MTGIKARRREREREKGQSKFQIKNGEKVSDRRRPKTVRWEGWEKGEG